MAAAGVMWSSVGIMLCTMAYRWLSTGPCRRPILMGCAGVVFAFIVYRFGFSEIALKNIRRLHLFEDKVCFFAFQAWRSYLIIVAMIGLGISLRHSPIPRCCLSVVYAAIGGALFLSSLHYYLCLWRALVLKQPCLFHERENGKETLPPS
jgi:hypothetical protein